MNADRSKLPLAQGFQWMVIPHGRTSPTPGSKKMPTQRITLRIIPQVTEDSVVPKSEYRVCDIRRSADIESVTNWPAFAAGIKSIRIGYTTPGSPQQVNGPSVPVDHVAQAFENARERQGCSSSTAERLWRALVFPDLPLKPLPSSCVPKSTGYLSAVRLAALPHATATNVLKETIGELYASGLALTIQGASSGVYRRRIAGEVTLSTTGRMEAPIASLMAMIGTGETTRDGRTSSGINEFDVPNVAGSNWAAERLVATGFQFSERASDLISRRLSTWRVSERSRDVGTGSRGKYLLEDAFVDRLLATASDLRQFGPDIDAIFRDPAPEVRRALAGREDVLEFHKEIGKLTFHPWLLEALGLAVDLEIEDPHFTYDPVALYVASIEHETGPILPSIQSRVVTSSFSAWLPHEDKPRNAEHEYFQGCVRMARTTAENKSLYVLEQLDIDAGTEKLLLLAQNLHTQFEAGVPADNREAMLSSLQTSGISLLRRNPSETDHCEAKRLDRKQQEARSNCVVDLYAEDLVIGYRPDMSLLAPDQLGGACRGPWKTLVGRELESVRIRGSYWPVHFSSRPRDEAIITAHARIRGNLDVEPPSASDNIILHSEELFCWRGWNLAVRPAESPEGKGDTDDPGLTLVPKYTSRGALPRQRFASGYRVGLRAVYADGKSLTLEEATRVYDDHIDCTLGTDHVGDQHATSSGKPDPTRYYTPFFRYEPIKPADVHLVKPLDYVKAPTARAEHAVVASDGFGNILVQATERRLVPPRVDLDLAIRAGAFDRPELRRAPPRGAFKNVELNSDGSFPAVGRNCIASLFGSKDGGETAYVESTTATPPQIPYLPDPWAKRLIIGIYRRADDQLLRLEYFDYYDEGRMWPDCKALGLRVEASVKESLPPIGFDSEWRDDTLLLKVPVGTALTLRCWHEMDEAKLAASGIVEAMARWLEGKDAYQVRDVLGLGTEDCCQDGLVDMRDRLVSCLSRWHERFPYDLRPYLVAGRPARDINLTSFSILNPTRTIYVTHAIPVPAREPRFSDADDVRSARAKTLPMTQSTFAKKFDVERHVRGATAGEFVGDIELHRASTTRLDCLADWEEYTDDIGTRWQKTTQHRQMFSIDSIPGVLANPPLYDKRGIMMLDESRRAELPQDNDLLLLKGNRESVGRTHNQDLKETFKHFDFGDAKARLVNFRLRGTSRFANDMAPANAGRYRESGPATSRWIRATLPPDKPNVAFIVPLFETGREATGNTFKQRRRGGWFRIWLERPWFSSGQGELLALACWPQEQFRPRGGSADYLRDKTKQAWGTLTGQNNAMPEPLVPLYTGWGIDPIWDQGNVRLKYIPPGAFANRLNVGLRTATPSQFFDGHAGDPKTLAMALALYQPVYDENEQRWYADIHIVPDENAYFPFVRLGLARYQPNAITGCELSEVVTSEFIQLVPDRSATIQIDRRAALSKVRVTIAGAQAAGPAHPDPDQEAKPRMIFRMDQGVTEFVSAGPPAWLPVREEISKAEELELMYDAKTHTWSREIYYDLKEGCMYSAYLEEQEAFLVDANPEAAAPGDPAVMRRVVYADRMLLQTRS